MTFNPKKRQRNQTVQLKRIIHTHCVQRTLLKYHFNATFVSEFKKIQNRRLLNYLKKHYYE